MSANTVTVKLAYNPTSNVHTTKGKITLTVSLVLFSSVAFVICFLSLTMDAKPPKESKEKRGRKKNRKEERQNLSFDNFKACPRHVSLEGMFYSMSSVCSFNTDTSYERVVFEIRYHQS